MTAARSRVKLTSLAARDIVDQADHYRERSGPTLAKRWRIAVRETVASLTTLPHRGDPCRFRNSSLNNIRRIEVQGFERTYIFYRVSDADGVILVLSIIHEARDIESLLARSI